MSKTSPSELTGIKHIKIITSNEADVRFRIYEGELKAEEGVLELLRVEKCQHASTQSQLLEANEKIRKLLDISLEWIPSSTRPDKTRTIIALHIFEGKYDCIQRLRFFSGDVLDDYTVPEGSWCSFHEDGELYEIEDLPEFWVYEEDFPVPKEE